MLGHVRLKSSLASRISAWILYLYSMSNFWVVTPCRIVSKYWRLGRTFCLHLPAGVYFSETMVSAHNFTLCHNPGGQIQLLRLHENLRSRIIFYIFLISPLWVCSKYIKSKIIRSIPLFDDELSDRRPTPKQEDHPLSAARDSLFSIFADTLHTWVPSPQTVTWERMALSPGRHSATTHWAVPVRTPPYCSPIASR